MTRTRRRWALGLACGLGAAAFFGDLSLGRAAVPDPTEPKKEKKGKK